MKLGARQRVRGLRRGGDLRVGLEPLADGSQKRGTNQGQHPCQTQQDPNGRPGAALPPNTAGGQAIESGSRE